MKMWGSLDYVPKLSLNHQHVYRDKKAVMGTIALNTKLKVSPSGNRITYTFIVPDNGKIILPAYWYPMTVVMQDGKVVKSWQDNTAAIAIHTTKGKHTVTVKEKIRLLYGSV